MGNIRMRKWSPMKPAQHYSFRRGLYVICLGVCGVTLATQPALGNPSVYEPGVDPGVGFNLISWWNFGTSGPSVWQNAVQSAHDAGFRQVSLSPVRYFNSATGAIAVTSQNGPELSHVAAGIARAKLLGMTVTVNPFVEFQNFAQWRAAWNPAPGSATANQFWTDYQQYMTSIAQMAQANGANAMNVGTEMRGIANNSANSSQWNSVINSVNANFSGRIGYAANWDDFKDANLTSAIWEHPAVDYLGVDAYFPMATGAQADASGTRPNPTFTNVLKDNWNTLLDNDVLPFAQARKGGAGMPVTFSEYGIMPYNRGVVQHSDVQVGTVDQDEQIMGFEAILSATDHRQANDDFLGIDLWQWGMPGSDGSLWNMDATLPADQTNNVPATKFLSDYVSHPVPEPAGFALACLAAATLLGRSRGAQLRPCN
jgi:hypothetical protein